MGHTFLVSTVYRKHYSFSTIFRLLNKHNFKCIFCILTLESLVHPDVPVDHVPDAQHEEEDGRLVREAAGRGGRRLDLLQQGLELKYHNEKHHKNLQSFCLLTFFLGGAFAFAIVIE